MANIFIIWDDNKIALEVRKRLSKKYPDDQFIVGGETNNNLAITNDILAEMDTSDFAICLISRVPLSENVFYELGYMTAQLRESYRLLVFLVNQSRESLPFDTSGNRSFTIQTLFSAQELYNSVCKEYGKSKERKVKEDGQKYITIFNNWPITKRRLRDLRSNMLNIERINDYLVHSIVPTYFYGKNEQEDLLSLCRDLPNWDGTLTAVKNLIFLVAEHYNIGSNKWNVYPLELSEKENIWLRFYAALYNGLQSVTFVERNLIAEEEYQSALERSVQYLIQARTLLEKIQELYFQEWKAPNFYMSLLNSFLWNNFAAAYGAQKHLYNENVDVRVCLQRSIEFREKAWKSYNTLAQVEKSDIILEALEREYLWGLLKEIKYLEEVEGVSCKGKRENLEKRFKQMKNRKLSQDFWDEQYNSVLR